ncbi:hypothetical protein GCM10009413_18360 [Tatumella punctata]
MSRFVDRHASQLATFLAYHPTVITPRLIRGCAGPASQSNAGGGLRFRNPLTEHL